MIANKLTAIIGALPGSSSGGVTVHNDLTGKELISGSAAFGHIDGTTYQNTFAFSNYYVNSGATVSSPDGSFIKPFTSLSDCMTAIGIPVSTADARRTIVVHIASGAYDENVVIPQQRLITFMCYGTVILGDGAADNLFNSTTPRNLTILNTATGEQPDAPSRPAFSVQVVAGETSSTHSAYNFGNMIVSGDLQFNHVDGNTTSHETYLSSVKVQGDVTANSNELGSVHNIQIEKCFFDNTFNLANVNINICNSTEFDGLITATGVCRFVNCEIDGGLTAEMFDYYPPNGFFDCDVGGGTWTITGAIVNETTRQQIVDNAITVTGGYIVTAKTAFLDSDQAFTGNNTFQDLTLTNNVLGTPTFSTLGDFMNIFSSGLISGGSISSNGDGTCTVAAGDGLVKIADNENSTTKFFNWAEDISVALVDDQLNYIYVNYNVATEAVTVSATLNFAALNKNYQFVISPVFRKGTDIEIINGGGVKLSNSRRDEWNRLEYRGIERMSGGIVSEIGTRNIGVTAAVYYKNNYPAVCAAIDTSGAGRFTAIYRDGAGGWTFSSGQQQFSNILYDDGDGTPGNVSPAKYAVYWVYQCLEDDIYIQYGQVLNRNLTQAQSATPPTPPNYLASWATLRAKIIILSGATNATEIEPYNEINFSTTVASNHNELTNRDIAGNHAKLIPLANSTTAIQLMKADGTTPILNIDSTNDKVEIPGSGKLLSVGTETEASSPAITLISEASGYDDPSNNGAESIGDKWVFWNKSSYKGAIGFSARTMWFQSTEGSATDSNRFKFYAGSAGVPVEVLSIGDGNTGFIWNDTGIDIDFRVESVGRANALFVQGSSGYVGIGLEPTANMDGLSIEAGLLTLKETTTPTADADYGKIYTKSDNKLYFQDGAGTEHEISFV